MVQTNHGIVNLIMNEYAYYGRGHRIHSSGQIEWYTNTVDNKSVPVCGQQRILIIDGYSMSLVCKGGLMYLQLQGIPTDQDLQNSLLFILQVLMNGIDLFWIMSILKTMENLLGQLIPTKSFSLTQFLKNLVTMPTDHCPFLTY